MAENKEIYTYGDTLANLKTKLARGQRGVTTDLEGSGDLNLLAIKEVVNDNLLMFRPYAYYDNLGIEHILDPFISGDENTVAFFGSDGMLTDSEFITVKSNERTVDGITFDYTNRSISTSSDSDTWSTLAPRSLILNDGSVRVTLDIDSGAPRLYMESGETHNTILLSCVSGTDPMLILTSASNDTNILGFNARVSDIRRATWTSSGHYFGVGDYLTYDDVDDRDVSGTALTVSSVDGYTAQVSSFLGFTHSYDDTYFTNLKTTSGESRWYSSRTEYTVGNSFRFVDSGGKTITAYGSGSSESILSGRDGFAHYYDGTYLSSWYTSTTSSLWTSNRNLFQIGNSFAFNDTSHTISSTDGVNNSNISPNQIQVNSFGYRASLWSSNKNTAGTVEVLFGLYGPLVTTATTYNPQLYMGTSGGATINYLDIVGGGVNIPNGKSYYINGTALSYSNVGAEASMGTKSAGLARWTGSAWTWDASSYLTSVSSLSISKIQGGAAARIPFAGATPFGLVDSDYLTFYNSSSTLQITSASAGISITPTGLRISNGSISSISFDGTKWQIGSLFLDSTGTDMISGQYKIGGAQHPHAVADITDLSTNYLPLTGGVLTNSLAIRYAAAGPYTSTSSSSNWPGGTILQVYNTDATTNGNFAGLDLIVNRSGIGARGYYGLIDPGSGYAGVHVWGARNGSTSYTEWMRLTATALTIPGLTLNNSARTYTTTLTTAASASWTLTLPATAGLSGQSLITDGSGNTSWASSSKSFTLYTPTAADKFTLFVADSAKTISKVYYHIVGGTNVVFNLLKNTDPTAAGTKVWTADKTATNLTSIVSTTSFDNAAISADNALQLSITSVSGAVTAIHVTVVYA